MFYNGDGNNSIDLFATPSSYAAYMNRAEANRNAQSAGQALDRMRWKSYAGMASPKQERLLYSVAGLDALQLPKSARQAPCPLPADNKIDSQGPPLAYLLKKPGRSII